MAGYVVVKIRCKKCMKRVSGGGSEMCQCASPQPERIEMRVMKPITVPNRPLQAVAYAQ